MTPRIRQIYIRSHVGAVRSENEDTAWASAPEGVAAVADGMGGHGNGRAASDAAITLVRLAAFARQDDPETALDLFRNIPARAHNAVLHLEGKPHHIPGTTLSALWFDGPVADVVHIGDSRIYRFRAGQLEPLTHDHGPVYEQFVRSGDLTREQLRRHPYRHILSRCIGGDSTPSEPDRFTIDVRPGDRFLLCSDGLSDMVPEPEIARALHAHACDLKELSAELVDLAMDAGGTDNITVVLVDIEGDGQW